ncbi:CLUMA_CG014824, isoform A [Clunio marinus]|uniref:CLUMA_CG014824, isoform A n=1 Tax=Clunio marinus TaxID=568069 RepID=A0A1J1IN65_9DIPT|nr:CLUMA_CG014824, isoform A [Clunio marinus]
MNNTLEDDPAQYQVTDNFFFCLQEFFIFCLMFRRKFEMENLFAIEINVFCHVVNWQTLIYVCVA